MIIFYHSIIAVFMSQSKPSVHGAGHYAKYVTLGVHLFKLHCIENLHCRDKGDGSWHKEATTGFQ